MAAVARTLETPQLGNKVTVFLGADLLVAADILARRSSLSLAVWLVRLAERETERAANQKPVSRRIKATTFHRNDITAESRARIKKAFKEKGTCLVSEVAAGFGVAKTSVRRMIAGNEDQE